MNFSKDSYAVDLLSDEIYSFGQDCMQSYSEKRPNLNGPCTLPPLLATDSLNTTFFESTSTFTNKIVSGYNITGSNYDMNVCLESNSEPWMCTVGTH